MTDPDYAKKLLDNTENIGELWSEWDEWGEHYALRPYNTIFFEGLKPTLLAGVGCGPLALDVGYHI